MRKNQIIGIGIMTLLLCYGFPNGLMAEVAIPEGGITQEEQVGWIPQCVEADNGEEQTDGDVCESNCPTCFDRNNSRVCDRCV